MFDFGMYGNEAEKRIICTETEFESWKSGRVVYLIKASCFAEYDLEYVSEGDVRAYAEDPINIISMAQGRYAYTRDQYDMEHEVGDFDTLTDDERQAYYLEHVLNTYMPVFYDPWAENGNESEDIVWRDGVDECSLKAFTMRLPATREKTREREESEAVLNG